MSVWDRITKAGLLVNLAVGLLVLIPVLFGYMAYVRGILPQSVPNWSLVIALVAGILLGILAGLLRRNARKSNSLSRSETHDTIRFDYRSANPRLHDWRITSKGEGEARFESTRDGRRGRVLNITLGANQYMDYSVSSSLSSATTMSLILKPGSEWFALFYIAVRSQDGTASKDVWISATYSNRAPEYYRDSKSEWRIELLPNQLENGWTELLVDLQDSVRKTFGREGWQYNRLLKIRLRGELTIAQIGFCDT